MMKRMRRKEQQRNQQQNEKQPAKTKKSSQSKKKKEVEPPSLKLILKKVQDPSKNPEQQDSHTLTSSHANELVKKGKFIVLKPSQESKWKQLKHNYKSYNDQFEQNREIGEFLKPKPKFHDKVEDIV